MTTPLTSLARLEAVQLMDELWRTGIRPTSVGESGKSNEAELIAVRLHLADMREMVASLMELKK